MATYGAYVDTENPRVGEPIRVKGRCFFLPDDCTLVLGYRTDDTGCVEKYLRAKRSLLCLYRAEYDLDPVDRPCQIVVYLNIHDGADSWTVKEQIVDVK
jgi:hypothetical protein